MDARQGSTAPKKKKKKDSSSPTSTSVVITPKKKKAKSKTDGGELHEVEEENPGMLLMDFVEEPLAASRKAIQSLKSSKTKKAGRRKRPAASDEEDLDLASFGQGSDDIEASQATAKLLSSINTSATSSSARVGVPRHAEEARPENEFQAGSVGEQISIEDLLAPLAESTGFSDVKKQLQGMSKTEAMPEPVSDVKQGREERTARYERSSREMKKWMPQIAQMQKADQIVLGEEDDHRPASTSSLVGSFKPLDDFEKELEEVTRAAGASEADVKGAKVLPMNSSIKDAREIQQRAKLKALMLREQQMSKRVKKIKSKTYHRIHRKAEQREREVLLERLEHENPELAKSLKQDYEKKFAEKRLQRQRNARTKWAQTMQRFAKGDSRAEAEISKQAQDARDEQVSLRRVIQGKNADQDDDSEAVDLSDDSDDDGDGQKGLAQRTVDKAKRLTVKELNGLKQGDEIPTTGLFGMPFMRNAIKEKRESAKAEAQSLLNELEGVGARLDAKEMDSDDERKESATAEGENKIVKKKLREFSAEELEKASKEIDLMFDQEDVTQATQADRCSVEGALTIRGIEAQQLPARTSKSDSKAAGDAVSTKAQSKPQEKDDDNPWMATTKPAAQDVDEDNPWLASDPKSKQGASDSLDSKAQVGENDKKTRKRKGAAAAAEPGSKQRRRRVADNEDPHADDHISGVASGAELLNVLDADADEARQQRDLVRATFIEGTQAEDFDDEKDAREQEQEDKNKPEELVGWGSWTGEGVKPRPVSKGKAFGKGKSGKGKGKGKDKSPKPAHVEFIGGDAATPASQAKFFVDKVPFPFRNPQQYDQEMRMPSGPEWNTLTQHLQRVKPKVFTKVGAIVPPLQYVKHLAPEHRENAINTWAAPKQPKRLKARF